MRSWRQPCGDNRHGRGGVYGGKRIRPAEIVKQMLTTTTRVCPRSTRNAPAA